MTPDVASVRTAPQGLALLGLIGILLVILPL
jgi:hypothetical protein